MSLAAPEIKTSLDSIRHPEEAEAPSAGRVSSRWIQAPIARVEFATISSQEIEAVGCYASARGSSVDAGARGDVTLWQLASAATFFAFEASLPENEEDRA